GTQRVSAVAAREGQLAPRAHSRLRPQADLRGREEPHRVRRAARAFVAQGPSELKGIPACADSPEASCLGTIRLRASVPPCALRPSLRSCRPPRPPAAGSSSTFGRYRDLTPPSCSSRPTLRRASRP